MSTWHLARARLGRARWISRSLSDECGIPTLCPADVVDLIHQGRLYRRIVPVFGPYVFFDAPITQNPGLWHQVAGWPYVAEIMGGEKPWPIQEQEAIFWQENTDDDGIVVDPELVKVLRRYGWRSGRRPTTAGQVVRISEGAFANLPGTVEWIDPKKILARVKIEGLLGQDIVISIPLVWCVTDGAAPSTAAASTRSRTHRGGARGIIGRRVVHRGAD